MTGWDMVDSDIHGGSAGVERKWLILAAVMAGSFMGPLDGSIVNTVLPEITRSFGTDISIAQWVPTVYLLTLSCLILLYGRLGDIIGYRRVFLIGLSGFTIASLLCGFSQSIWMLIGFRALQGLAAGMTTAVGIAIITAAFPPQERGKALGLYAVSIAAALGLGPTLGGLLAEYLSWRYVFFVNVPIGLISVLWCYRVVPHSVTNPGQRLDWRGASAAFIFLTSLLLFANRGQDWGWSSAAIISLLVVAVISAAVFLWVERRMEQPMLDLRLFKSRVFSFASLSALINFMSLYALIFITPFYLAFVLGFSILKVGLVMAASPIATLFVAPVSGALSDRIGTRPFAVCGMFLCAIGLYMMSGLEATSSVPDVIWRLIVCGVGSGMFQSPNNSAIMGSVPVMRLGVASGMISTMRTVGMVLGIAVVGAVLYNLAPVAASGNLGQLTSTEAGEFMGGLRWAYISGAIMAAIAAVTSLAAVKRRGDG
jgi:EmrB/QacA subfamily drug resistance transporter